MPPDTQTREPTLLDKLRDRRNKLVEDWAAEVDRFDTERAAFEERQASTDNKPTDEQIEARRQADEEFQADSADRQRDIDDVEKRIKDHERIVEARRVAAEQHRGDTVDVTGEPLTYRRDNAHERSYFRDLAVVSNSHAAAGVRSTTPQAAQERLFRHAVEMDKERPKRAEIREQRALGQAENAAGRRLATSPFEKRVNPNRTDGQGGYFIPPVWWVDEFIPFLRAGRTTADLCRLVDLPEGTDSINIPKLATGTAVGYQTSDNAGVVAQDYTDTATTANVKTLAGEVDVAIQTIEQSPGEIVDMVIGQDLLAAYNMSLDQIVISGNGSGAALLSGGNIAGLYGNSAWGQLGVTYTDSGPTGQHILPSFAAAVSKIAGKRFNLMNVAGVLSPRRWFWYASQLDGNGRPLVESPDGSPWNVAALMEDEVPAEGLVGNLPFGPPIHIDANVPTTDATGGTANEDVGIFAKWDDVWLMEGEMRSRVLAEVLSGTLELRYQVYNYVAFLVRYGQSVCIITGTGMARPSTGYGDNFD